MATDLSDYIDFLKAAVNAPGEDNFPNATDDDWLTRLSNGFWSARIDGIMPSYTEADGLIFPDMPRDLVQVVIFFAAMDVVLNALRSVKTLFRAQAGPVEYETQQSASTLRELLLDLKSRRDILLVRLSDIGIVPSYVMDNLTNMDNSLMYGDTYWTRGTSGPNSVGGY